LSLYLFISILFCFFTTNASAINNLRKDLTTASVHIFSHLNSPQFTKTPYLPPQYAPSLPSTPKIAPQFHTPTNNLPSSHNIHPSTRIIPTAYLLRSQKNRSPSQTHTPTTPQFHPSPHTAKFPQPATISVQLHTRTTPPNSQIPFHTPRTDASPNPHQRQLAIVTTT